MINDYALLKTLNQSKSLRALRFAQDKLSEAISKTTMAFSARRTRDCPGLSCLAMTEKRRFAP